jgi:hypothetical protein
LRLTLDTKRLSLQKPVGKAVKVNKADGIICYYDFDLTSFRESSWWIVLSIFDVREPKKLPFSIEINPNDYTFNSLFIQDEYTA